MEQAPKRPIKGNIDGFITPRVRPYAPDSDRSQARPNLRTLASEEAKPAAKPSHVASKEAGKFNPYYSRTAQQSRYDRSKAKKRHLTKKQRILTTILVILLLVFGIGGWYGSKIISSLDKAFHGNVFSDVHALFSSVTLKGENQGRVNILVAGDSSDDPDHQGAQLTDSIMLLSINTKTHTGFMLSIPRDLWVYVPGLGSYQKINSANEVSMNQLQQIVQTDLGIPVDYYALIDYGAFKDSVDAVGGITINVQSSDPRGLYDAYTHLKLPNGEDELTGQEALDLARARGDDSAGDISYGFPNTDFSRTQHQRQMVIAIVKKAMTVGVLTNPVKISNLVKAVGNNVETNMSLQDVLRLAQITKGLNFNKLGSYTYSSTTTGANANTALLTDYTSPAGQDALAPTAGVGEYGQLQEYYEQLVSNNPVVKEGASVAVLNGSNADGLAAKGRSMLKTNKIDNVVIGDAYNEYPDTLIVDNSNGQDPATKALLERLFPGAAVATGNGDSTSSAYLEEAKEAEGYSTNFVVILGQNSASIKQP